MTIKDMRLAGQITTQVSFTDEELKVALMGTRLALSYLEGKGADWMLAIRPLRLELSQLEQFQDNRKRL